MNILSRPPNRPYRNLFLAALVGVAAGSLVVSLFLALFQSTSLTQSLTLIADALFVSSIGYAAMALLLLAYGLPALRLALRFRLAGPAPALLIATLPGLCIWFLGGTRGSLAWLPLAISVATGLAFVALAYRGTPSNNSFKPKPLRGAA